MNKLDYVKQLGFTINPFANTNADLEKDYIEEYFISPDYFEDVWGDIENPVSNIVFAPRGAGKTAQRVMIEKRAERVKNLITISYTDHDLSKFKTTSDISISYHLEFLNRLLLLSFFDRLLKLEDFDYIYEFSFKERQFLYKLCKIYLYDTPVSFPNQAVKSLKTFEDQALDVWNNFRGPISEVIQRISKMKGMEVDISSIDLDKKLTLSHKDNFINIVSFVNRLKIDCIYILIDKVDEQSLTGNDPSASYNLIAPLIKDLELLEMPGLGFKFFLWDALKPFCAKDARPDRIFSYNLRWTDKQIWEMLNKRLNAYSNGKVKNALDLMELKKNLGRIILFSEYSPRDCIRICNRALSEQFKHNNKSTRFQSHIVNSAIDEFCKDKILEILPDSKSIAYLVKSNSVSFTIESLVNKKVAGTKAAIRNIIRPWYKYNLHKKIGTQKRKNSKAVNEYAFEDIRAARLACSSMSLDNFIAYKVRKCSSENCVNIYYRNFDEKEFTCLECGVANL